MSNLKLKQDQSSFRDPSGHVFEGGDGAIYRTVNPVAQAAFEAVEATGVVRDLERDGLLVPSRRTDETPPGAAYLLQHPRLPFISYPYEWTFEQLRDAALLHLDLHERCLRRGVTLSDATAYNVQFDGHRPVFIDRLSLIPYEDGMLWHGQKQFVEQFVSPLLLWAYGKVPFNEWYLGNLTGIPPAAVDGILPLRRRMTPAYLSHIGLPLHYEKKTARREAVARKIGAARLPKEALLFMLHQLRRWIEKLPAPHDESFWRDYKAFRTYSDDEVRRKLGFVAQAVGEAGPRLSWDIGCNTGEFSEQALKAGAGYAVGFELDHGALAGAYRAAKKGKLPFLPLYVDVCKPTPAAGWNQAERKGLLQRANADFVMGLAVLHHIVIGGNVPLVQAVDFFVSLAPAGVLEWVPKEDAMVRNMLSTRKDIFPDYGLDAFRAYLRKRCTITREETVSESGRVLLSYRRNDP